MSDRTCPRCHEPLALGHLLMSKLDHCEACRLLFLDAGELDFLLGRQDIERGFARLAEGSKGPACPDCAQPMQAVRTGLRVKRRGANPYRDAAMVEEELDGISRCAACGGMVLTDEAFQPLLRAFHPQRERALPEEEEWFRSFRVALFAAIDR